MTTKLLEAIRIRWPQEDGHDTIWIQQDNAPSHVHTDEKWFNGTRKNKTMYMHPDEEDPHRTVQNKNAIHKVMFYSGVTQPRFDAGGRCYFDGKLGVWPFVREVAILVMFYSCFAT